MLALLALPQATAFLDRSDDEDALTVTLVRPQRPLTTARSQPVNASSVDGRPLAVRPSPRLPALPVPPGVPTLPTLPAIGTGNASAPPPEGPRGDLRTALRSSGVGCANGTAVGLNRREQERCDERWGEAARRAPLYSEAPMDPAKRAAFDQIAAGQAAARRYRQAPMGPGVDHRSRDGPGQVKEIPFVMGNTDGIGRKKSDESLGIRR
ncbi:hypothetical protein [Caulobacter henricii]|uniref:hypothetical protein n=1 Tax=Caulobacter henricii TaxID=69395 RepID=UPI000B1B1645|nr:hypothetical protein [Caulobacter henricii]